MSFRPSGRATPSIPGVGAWFDSREVHGPVVHYRTVGGNSIRHFGNGVATDQEEVEYTYLGSVYEPSLGKRRRS